MKIRVKLVSMDGPMPKGFDDFGEADISFTAAPSVTDLINHLVLGKDETYMVLVNSETSPPSGRDQQILTDGDDVAIFPPMQGG
jgi:sulfur carrier protein ThiS